MKKAGIILITMIVFLIIYFLQANFFTWFTIAGIKPNLFIVLALFMGLFAGRKVGLSFGIVFGLLIDLFIGKQLGISAITLGIIGLLGGILDKNFSKESRITMMIMVAGATVLCEIGGYIANIFLFSITIELLPFMITVFIEAIYNIILTIIFYPLMQRAGCYIEEVIKGNRILTRYF